MTPEHMCTFVEEREPNGRLIVTPCLECGQSAMEGLKKLAASEQRHDTLHNQFLEMRTRWRITKTLAESLEVERDALAAQVAALLEKLNANQCE